MTVEVYSDTVLEFQWQFPRIVGLGQSWTALDSGTGVFECCQSSHSIASVISELHMQSPISITAEETACSVKGV